MAAFALAWGWVAARLLDSLSLERAVWVLPAAFAAGFLLADFVAGAVHWFADTYFDPATPVLGPLLIEPFRDHHRDPQGITRHGLLELCGNSALATLPIAAGLLWLGPPGGSVPVELLHASVLALAMALFATNVFHRWAHMRRPPALAVWLQRRRLVLPPAVHDRHHAAAHDRSYCVTCGWLNPLLDRTRFFARVERLLAAIGVAPMRDEVGAGVPAAGGAGLGASATGAEGPGPG